MSRQIIAEIKPTYRCNQHCPFCIWKNRKFLLSLTLEDVKRILAYVRENLNPACIVLSGGEPTIRPDFAQIVQGINALQDLKTFHLHTNATRIVKFREVLSLAIAEQKSATVGIHGHCASVHDRVTGVKGSFENFVVGIKTLLSLDFVVRSVCVVCVHNYKYLSEITEFLLNVGANLVEVRLPFVGPEQDLAELMVNRAELDEVLERWNNRFSKEPRARFIASASRCFNSVVLDPEEDGETEYHFFDISYKKGIQRCATSQLAAIWPEAYDNYQKSNQCVSCVLDDVCRGYSREELKKGYASYSPKGANMFLRNL